MHRTGTSMVARMLRDGGLWFGEDESFISPASDNPEGFFEHERLVRLNDELLEATGGAWDHPPDSGPVAADDPRVAHLSEKARGTIAELSGHARWAWKDPRICLTAGLWLDLVPNLQFIVCVRHPLEVAMSLKRRNQTSYALGLSLWERYYAEVLEVVPTSRRLITHFGALLDAGDQEADRLFDFADIPSPSRRHALEAINPELRHQRTRVSLADAGVSRPIVELYDALCREAGWKDEQLVNEQVSVHAAVLDLVTTKELAERQGRAISALEGRLTDARDERDALVGRVRELESERADLAGRLQGLEDEKERLSNQVGSLEKTSLLLGERLAAVENDATASLVAAVDQRMDAVELGVRQLIDRVGSNGAEDPVVRGGRKAIYDHTPSGSSILVAGKSDPGFTELYGRRMSNFPQDASGRYPGFALANSQALLAHFEALRRDGNRFLLIPSPSKWMLDYYSQFSEYLLERHQVVADDPGFGVLFDITDRQPLTRRWPNGLSSVFERLAKRTGRSLAVLDMTDLHIAPRVPRHNVFSAPSREGALPYLDSTIDVVVIDDDIDHAEAQRTATEAIVQVGRGPNGLPEVISVETLTRGEEGGRVAVVVVSASSASSWADRLAEVVDEDATAFMATSPADFDGADAVALVDDGVLPLPSCLSSALRLLLSSDVTGGVAVKLLGPSGALDGAGAMVFADGSVMGVGDGSFDVDAPWHQYVRETCWGLGLMLFRADAVRDLLCLNPRPGAQASWSEHVWRSGSRVLYQPAAAAVRAVRDRQHLKEGAEAWSAQLGRRPRRPAQFDRTTWHSLLAAEDLSGGTR
jgi:hypothetical protein